MELSDNESALWYFQYFVLPISLCIIIYKCKNSYFSRKQKTFLRDKVVVITDACSGLGEALSHIFYEQGCKVILASERTIYLERIKRNLISKRNAYSKEPLVLELDRRNLRNFIYKIWVTCGNIDIIINNVGFSPRASILHTKLEAYKELMETNFYLPVGLTLAALPNMVKRNSGHIVYINSVQGLIALPEYSAYAASKHALQAFGDSLRAEMKQHKINISTINLGYIKTDVQINALSGAAYRIVDAANINAGLSRRRVASKIVKTVVNAENDAVISQFIGHLGIFLRHNMPSLYHFIAAHQADRTSYTCF